MTAKKTSRRVCQRDIKLLYGLSAGCCNVCGCFIFEEKKGEEGFIHLGEMAHNVAYSTNKKAPRFIDKSSPNNTYENLILLCPSDHERVDQDTNFFTVEKIKEIKKTFESSVRIKLSNEKQPDKFLVNKINKSCNFQNILNETNDPLSYLPDDIMDLVDINDTILVLNTPTLYPFYDDNLNHYMEKIVKDAQDLRYLTATRYVPAENPHFLKPININLISESDQKKIVAIIGRLKNHLKDWLKYCREHAF